MQSWLFCLFCKLAIFTRKQVNRRQQTWLLRHNLLTFCFLHRLKVTEPIEYTLVSLTYTKFSQPTTTQPPYLHSLISFERPRNTRKERQAWCNLQVKLCDPYLSALRL